MLEEVPGIPVNQVEPFESRWNVHGGLIIFQVPFKKPGVEPLSLGRKGKMRTEVQN